MFSINLLTLGLLIFFGQTSSSDRTLLCDSGSKEVERTVAKTALTVQRIEGFAAVARARQKEGVDALPGLTGCPSIAGAARDVAADTISTNMLQAHGLTAKDYVAIGWTILIALNPDDFADSSKLDQKLLARNVLLVESKKEQLEDLLKSD